jgi:hypothetical protein
LHHIRHRTNHLNVDVQDGTPLFCHVLTGYGIVFRIPAHSAMGFGNYRTTKIETCCDARISDCCVQRDQHRYSLSLSCVERTVSMFNPTRDPELTSNSLYRMGCIVLTVALLCCAVASLILRFWLQRLNRKSDQAVGLEGVANGPGALFRYML